jgi:hypothetical protein
MLEIIATPDVIEASAEEGQNLVNFDKRRWVTLESDLLERHLIFFIEGTSAILSANQNPSHRLVKTLIQMNRTDEASSVLTSSRRRSLCYNSTPAASKRRQPENRPTQA